MRYAIATCWFERRRFFAGVLAVAFSASLVSLLVGILLGLVSTVSAPVDRSTAELWLAAPKTESCDGGMPLARRWMNRLAMLPEVAQTDDFIQSFSYWKTARVGTVLCMVVGCNLDPATLGPGRLLTPAQRVALKETGAVLIDRGEAGRLGIVAAGETAEILHTRLRVVGFLEGMGSMTAPYVFCSRPTARRILWAYGGDTSTYLLGKCRTADDVPAALARLGHLEDVAVYTRDQFSFKSRLFWIRTTKSGLSVAFVALLGLVVGAVITTQTLHAAILAHVRELATLVAMGVPRPRIRGFVVQLALVVGSLGVLIALPTTKAAQGIGAVLGAPIALPGWLLAAASIVTLIVSALSGLMALRSLRQVDPAVLLR